MNDQSQITRQCQILENQNYVIGRKPPAPAPTPPFPPENSAFTFQSPYPHRPVFSASAAAMTRSSSRINWNGNKSDNRKEFRRGDWLGGSVPGHCPKPSNPNDLQPQNHFKGRRFHHPKKKFSKRFAPQAPRNTTSFLIRAKKSGGVASLVSPCPVTPAVLPTPIFSPSREVVVDMAKEEWGVDGYGSMKGLIRLRSGSPMDEGEDDDEDEDGVAVAVDDGGSSDSDTEERVEVERRLDHDLSRFEMIYPNANGGDEQSSALENRVDEQDFHIAQLEEENLTLRERIFPMERELNELRMRIQCLETNGRRRARKNNIGEVPENDQDVAGVVCSEKSVGNGDHDDYNDAV